LGGPKRKMSWAPAPSPKKRMPAERATGETNRGGGGGRVPTYHHEQLKRMREIKKGFQRKILRPSKAKKSAREVTKEKTRKKTRKG